MTNHDKELREQIDILFNPIQAEYDNEAPMMPGDINRIKSEIFDFIASEVAKAELALLEDVQSFDNGTTAGFRNMVGFIEAKCEALTEERNTLKGKK